MLHYVNFCKSTSEEGNSRTRKKPPVCGALLWFQFHGLCYCTIIPGGHHHPVNDNEQQPSNDDMTMPMTFRMAISLAWLRVTSMIEDASSKLVVLRSSSWMLQAWAVMALVLLAYQKQSLNYFRLPDFHACNSWYNKHISNVFGSSEFLQYQDPSHRTYKNYY